MPENQLLLTKKRKPPPRRLMVLLKFGKAATFLPFLQMNLIFYQAGRKTTLNAESLFKESNSLPIRLNLNSLRLLDFPMCLKNFSINRWKKNLAKVSF